MSEEILLSKYDQSLQERTEYVNKILSSSSIKKVVVAGPGTGKTYLFKQILQDKKNCLTLTFVNSLVEDLSLELYGMSEVRTLHSYARSILSKLTPKDIKLFPKFSQIVTEDAKLLLNVEADFDKIFYARDDDNEHLVFYKNRRVYYNYYGYASIIFALVKCFEKYPTSVPSYEQILIDEFQDFNQLEVSLIDLLSDKSPILLAGDDDQALYEFKSASTKFIRERNDGQMPEYESFTLPYCSRCTRVVVGATNDILIESKRINLLIGRIDKDYKYFDDIDKDKTSNKYPKIAYAQVFDKQIPWFIEKNIQELVSQERKNFTVLIISPFKKQSIYIHKSLQSKGFKNLDFVLKKQQTLNILDGFKLLLEDRNDNLGWRIITKFLLPKNEFEELLKKTNSDSAERIIDLISMDNKRQIKNILKVIRSIKDNKSVDSDELDQVLSFLNLSSLDILKKFLFNEVDFSQTKNSDPAIRKIPIKLTTIQSSKGLAADFVFITHFDDKYFIKNEDKTVIIDQDVCNFLVALTRTKSKLFLISSTKEKPTFLKWLNENRYDIIEVKN